MTEEPNTQLSQESDNKILERLSNIESTLSDIKSILDERLPVIGKPCVISDTRITGLMNQAEELEILGRDIINVFYADCQFYMIYVA